MKILFVDQNVLFGGGQKQLVDFIKSVKNFEDFFITTVVSKNNKRLTAELEKLDIEVEQIDFRWARGKFKYIYFIYNLLLSSCAIFKKRNKYDIIYTTSFISSLSLSILNLILSLPPHVYSVMNPYYYSKYGFLTKFVFTQYQYLIFNSNYTLNSYKKFINDEHTTHINYSLVPKVDEIKGNMISFDDHYTIGTVGRVVPRKNLELFLQTAHIIDKTVKSKFIVIGSIDDDQYYEYLSGLVTKLNIDCDFIGFLENPFPIMSTFDLFIQTTHGEAFGRVVLESIMLKTPVVVVKPSGAEEIVNEDVGRVAAMHPEEIAIKSIEILTDSFSFDNSDVLNKFDSKKLIDDEIRFLKKVIAK